MRRALPVMVVLLLAAPWPVTEVNAGAEPAHYVGWAAEAYPEVTGSEMEAMVRRMADAGASVVWIGHNNPGEVEAGKVEPGLSYAVYEAYRDSADSRHGEAVAVVGAQQRMLEACRIVGIKAVLPVGYQIQMGEVWNTDHAADLRRDAQGRPLDIYGGGISASFYAPSYRWDIQAYYRWLNETLVEPYSDVILMLNLADEPIGGDFSAHAEKEFRRRHGFGFGEVGRDPLREALLGAFQSRYVVEYATYSAGLWQEIHPGLPVTMSFDGAQARKTFSLPDVEALFRDTPANFVVTFDAYPHDGLPHVPLNDRNLVGLFVLARSLGLYSARYGKPLWLWAAANSWGLSQASPDPGTVSDAVVNGLSLALLVQQGGGDLQGIVFWNYNVKGQGMYNDTHATAYDPEMMFAQVSGGLHLLRRVMSEPSGRPNLLILAPPAVAHQQIGAAQEAVRLEVQPFRRLAILAKEGLDAAVVGSLSGWPLEGVRAIIVLSPAVEHLARGDLAILDGYLAEGGNVVTSPAVGAMLAEAPGAAPDILYDGLVERRGRLYIAQKGIAVLFEDRRHGVLAPFWKELLGLASPQPGYRIVTERRALLYHIGPDPARLQLTLPYEAYGARYDANAQVVEHLRGWHLTTALERREYVLLVRGARSQPWID